MGVLYGLGPPFVKAFSNIGANVRPFVPLRRIGVNGAS